MSGHRASVEMDFQPNWTYLPAVRSFVREFISVSHADKKKAEAIALAVNEMIENAIKYSDREGVRIRLDLSAALSVTVAVHNHAAAAEIRNLQSLLAEINKQPPLEAYLDRMQATGESKDNKSSLGLARIRYETGAKVSARYDEQDGEVTVLAEFEPPATTEEGS